jgi:hypothetical protein
MVIASEAIEVVKNHVNDITLLPSFDGKNVLIFSKRNQKPNELRKRKTGMFSIDGDVSIQIKNLAIEFCDEILL